jgi:uncharacterized C2H2 Zn-finger protein
MPLFICINCEKTFNRKSNYVYHIDKKIKPCIKKNITIDEEITNNDNLADKCIYCNKIFTTKHSLIRHLKNRCKHKKNINDYEKLKNENEKLKKENEQLKNNSNTSQIINNINNVNTTINNNVNVQLVRFGNENIDKLDIQEALDIYYLSTG